MSPHHEARARWAIARSGWPPSCSASASQWVAPATTLMHLAAIAIEYEGDDHCDAGRWERDIERRELFEDAGWRVIRVTRQALFDEPDQLIARIRRARHARSNA